MKKSSYRVRSAVKQFSGVLLATTMLYGSLVLAETAGSVESGLASLAKQIADKSVAADRKTIAVLPFPNADGSCSVLSTYLVDELILGLFSVPDSPVTIIERAQMEALISEISIGEGGLLNPETTQKLGSISGVQALTVGTITVIGDSVRVNARVVNTETGRTISAAAVTLPRTNAVTQLLQQPLSQNVACGSNSGPTAVRAASPTLPFAGGMVGTIPALVPGNAAAVTAGDISIHINKVLQTGEGQYRAVGVVQNLTQENVLVMWLGPVLLLDTVGEQLDAMDATGIKPCQGGSSWGKRSNDCRNKDVDYTIVAAGSPRNFAINFGHRRSGVTLASQVALSGRVWVRGANEAEHPFNFPALLLETAKGK